MSKNVLLSVVAFSVLMVMSVYAQIASAQDQATQAAPATVVAAPAPSAAPAVAVRPATQYYNYNSAATNRATRQSIGFGFDGIPFNGSHLAALRARRAYR